MQKLLIFMTILTVLSGCCSRNTVTNIQRFGWVIAVKPDKVERYKELHANAWPGVQRMITACNIRNYSIYLRELEPGKWYLFSYLEYTGANFKADMARMAADDETRRWWSETDPCQQPITLAKPGDKWSDMELVYRQER